MKCLLYEHHQFYKKDIEDYETKFCQDVKFLLSEIY